MPAAMCWGVPAEQALFFSVMASAEAVVGEARVSAVSPAVSAVSMVQSVDGDGEGDGKPGAQA